jgi:hypothetical protein
MIIRRLARAAFELYVFVHLLNDFCRFILWTGWIR